MVVAYIMVKKTLEGNAMLQELIGTVGVALLAFMVVSFVWIVSVGADYQQEKRLSRMITENHE
jgi:hypothetical protein